MKGCKRECENDIPSGVSKSASIDNDSREQPENVNTDYDGNEYFVALK
jgi:hypothetical protein